MKIKLCDETFLSSIAFVESVVFKAHVGDMLNEIYMDIKKQRYYVCINSRNNLSGYLCLHDKGTGLYLHNIVVLPEYRHLGYGKRMLNFAKEKMIEYNQDRIFLHVDIQNEIAIRLYERNKFKIVGIEKDFYAPNEDALIMEYR